MTDKPISYQPTDGLSYDPEEATLLGRRRACRGRSRATFEVCHGCRMCFKYCDSFPILFDLIDKKHDGDVRKLTAAETDRVMDACFQCKLCEVQCPYTPRDKHEFQLDFPKLVHRYKAQRGEGARHPAPRPHPREPRRGRRHGPRSSFGMANVMNRVTLHRMFMETALGIHQDKLLPDFAAHDLREVGGARTGASSRSRTASRRCSSRPATCRTTSPRSGATPSRCSTGTR